MVADTLNQKYDGNSPRRFAMGKVVKNAAPSQEVVAQLMAKRSGGGPDGQEEGGPSVSDQLSELADGLGQMFDLMVAIHEQEKSRDKVFDTLYTELNDYKNDFFYERLKPIVRPLLFLLDSIEQFQEEIASRDDPGASSVKLNLEHFHDQLVEVLHICEMQPMEAPDGDFNAKTQKAVEVVPVKPDQDGKVQRVVRKGWTMNGQMLRPSDVVVGKS